MRKVDKLGRIVIPLELRKKYGLSEAATIEFIDTGDGITVKASDPFCRVCRSKISQKAKLPLCDECILKAVKSYNENNIAEKNVR